MVKIGVFEIDADEKFDLSHLINFSGTQFEGVFSKLENSLFLAENGLSNMDALEDLLEKCDAIFLPQYQKSGFDDCKKIIKSGKHLFVINPIKLTIPEAQELILLSKESNVFCMVGFEDRFNPAYVQIKDKIQNPLFLESHRLLPFHTKHGQENVIMDLMIFDIDLVQSMVKSEIKRISATGINVLSNDIDIANARIEFSNGCIANLTASRIAQNEMQKIRIFQKDCYFNIDFHEQSSEQVFLKELDKNNLNKQNIIDLPNGDQKIIHIEKRQEEKKIPMVATIQYFIDSLSMQRNILPNFQSASDAIEIANRITKKINTLND